MKATGKGVGALGIGWKTSEGKWTAAADDARFLPSTLPDAEGWREIAGLVEVPPAAGQVVFMACVGAQSSDGSCEFDDAELVVVAPDDHAK